MQALAGLKKQKGKPMKPTPVLLACLIGLAVRMASALPALLTRSARLWTALGRAARLLLLLVLALPAVVQAQFNYTTDNGTITITGYAGPGGAVTIPSTINGLPVTR